MSHTHPASSVAHAALAYGGAIALALALSYGLPACRTAWAPPPDALPWLAGLALGAALVLASWLLERVWPQFRALADTLAAMLGPVAPLQALALALWSGVGEEALFRGPLQAALGPLPATLLFAGLHGAGNRRLWPWPAFALVAGAGFAWLAWQFGSPWPSALAHVVVNAVNLRRLGARHAARGASVRHV